MGAGPAGLATLLTAQFYSPAVHAGRIDASPSITHYVKLDQILQAYETFGMAAETQALKVIIEA